jgi:uncharacterized protein with GYD domain
MTKFLFHGSYTAEGVKGLFKEGAAGRLAVVKKGIASVGGKLESFYWTMGKDDVVLIADLPDAESAAALSLTVSASGFVRIRTTQLMTTEEIDRALGKSVKYRAPGA